MKIFVSYTTLDAEISISSLTQISEKLNQVNDTFIDLLDNDSKDKQKRVCHELESCDLVVLIKTKNVYASKWVKFELSKAQELGIPIAPFKMLELLTLQINELSNKLQSYSRK